MKTRLFAAGLTVLVAALLVNSIFVNRSERAAAPFAGGHVLTLDGPDLNVREYGPASAQTSDRAIVLLHGYTASIEWWQQVAEALAAGGRRVIAVDLVGHGGSEAPRDPASYGAAGQSAAVQRALEALGVRHATLIGHSMGGHIATALTQAHPEEIDRVVVADTFGAEGLKDLPLLGRMSCWPLIGQNTDRLRGIETLTDGSLQSGFAPGFPVPALAHRSLAQMTHTGMCDSTAGAELNRGEAVADRLSHLGKPVEVIWGSEDVLTPTATNVARYRAAGLNPVIIDGAGHSPMVEKPDAFFAAIADFVRSQPQ